MFSYHKWFQKNETFVLGFMNRFAFSYHVDIGIYYVCTSYVKTHSITAKNLQKLAKTTKDACKLCMLPPTGETRRQQ